MMRARPIYDVRPALTLAVALASVLTGAAIYAYNVTAAPRLSQHPSDSHGSPMLVVTAPPALQGRGENATRRAEARQRASTMTAWTSARGA